MRYKRIFSDAKELKLQMTTLKNEFTALGYKPKTVENQIFKAMSIPREALLNYQTKSESNCILLSLLTTPILDQSTKLPKICNL